MITRPLLLLCPPLSVMILLSTNPERLAHVVPYYMMFRVSDICANLFPPFFLLAPLLGSTKPLRRGLYDIVQIIKQAFEMFHFVPLRFKPSY